MQLSQLNGSRAGLFEGDLIYIGQYDPPPPPPRNFHTGRGTNPI